MRLPRTLLSIVLAAAAAAPLAAQHEHHRMPSSPPQGTEEVKNLEIPDTLVRDQDGREVHFYRDLVADRVVAMNFIFTTCTTICPPMGANFSRLERLLGESDGRNVRLISVSVDPLVDTPERLKQWQARFGERPEGADWTLITGRKSDIDALLKALKVFSPDPEDHTPILLLGNDATDTWQRTYGLAPPDSVVALLDQLAGGPGAGRGAAR